MEIELYLKKNRSFAKVDKIDIINKLEFIDNKLNELSNSEIKFIIFQDKIYKNHSQRFLYVDDTYVFILNNNDLFNIVTEINFDSFSFDRIFSIREEKLITIYNKNV